MLFYRTQLSLIMNKCKKNIICNESLQKHVKMSMQRCYFLIYNNLNYEKKVEKL